MDKHAPSTRNLSSLVEPSVQKLFYHWLFVAAAPLYALGLLVLGTLSWALFLVVTSPLDYQQKIAVKILYLHVPCAWLSMLCYLVMSAGALCVLLRSSFFAALFLKASAPIGAFFTALTLITGSLWGHITWGTWWEWDARLTSVLLLFFLYLAIVVLFYSFDTFYKGVKAGALFTLLGLINIPIIKFSVNWWNSLHQPASLLRQGGCALAPSMLWPLIGMSLAFLFFWLLLEILALRVAFLQHSYRRALCSFTQTPKEGESYDNAFF